MTTFAILIALAVAPVIKEVTPPGAQRGKTAKVVLKGEGLTPAAKIVTSIPGSVTKMTGSDFTLLVEVKPDAEVGVYPLRLLTDDGLSNLVLFSVGSLPEGAESEEKHASREKAQKITAPMTVNATLDGPEIDYYAIDISAPRKLVIEIDARRAGSAIDPAFEIEDAQGRTIARNDDGVGCGVDSRREVSFPRAGKYFVRVHDSKYSTQAVDFYRLKIGQWQYADTLSPIGGWAGKSGEIELQGGNLPKTLVQTVAFDASAPYTPIRISGSASLPLLAMNYSTAPASGETRDGHFKPREKVEIPRTVRPGETWVVEAVGRAAAATLAEPIITVFGPDGKKIAGRDDVSNPNLAVPFTVPKDVYEVRIVVEDLVGRSGPQYAYHVAMDRAPADFVAAIATPFVNVPAGGTAIVPIQIRRRGYDGPVKVSIPDLPPGLSLAGGNIPSEAAAQSFNNDNAGFRTTNGMLTLTAAPNIEPKFAELKVVAVADTPDGRIVREARGPGISVTVRGLKQNAVTAPWLGSKLPFATAKPLPVALKIASPETRIAQGFEYPMGYRVQRRAGVKPLERIRDVQVSAVGNLRILQSDPNQKSPDSGSLLLSTNFSSPVSRFDLLMQGEAEIDGKMQTIYGPMLEVEIVPGYQVLPDSPAVMARPGEALTLKGQIYREPTFEGGPVKLDVQELPDGASCGKADVAAESREFSISCTLAANTAMGEYEIFLSSTAPDVGKKAKAEYKAAPVSMKLKVGK